MTGQQHRSSRLSMVSLIQQTKAFGATIPTLLQGITFTRNYKEFFFLKKNNGSRKVKHNVLYQKAPMASQKETAQQAPRQGLQQQPSLPQQGCLSTAVKTKAPASLSEQPQLWPPHQLRCIYIFKNLFHAHSSKSSRLDSSLALVLQAEGMQKKKQNKPKHNRKPKGFPSPTFCTSRKTDELSTASLPRWDSLAPADSSTKHESKAQLQNTPASQHAEGLRQWEGCNLIPCAAPNAGLLLSLVVVNMMAINETQSIASSSQCRKHTPNPTTAPSPSLSTLSSFC